MWRWRMLAFFSWLLNVFSLIVAVKKIFGFPAQLKKATCNWSYYQFSTIWTLVDMIRRSILFFTDSTNDVCFSVISLHDQCSCLMNFHLGFVQADFLWCDSWLYFRWMSLPQAISNLMVSVSCSLYASTARQSLTPLCWCVLKQTGHSMMMVPLRLLAKRRRTVPERDLCTLLVRARLPLWVCEFGNQFARWLFFVGAHRCSVNRCYDRWSGCYCCDRRCCCDHQWC